MRYWIACITLTLLSSTAHAAAIPADWAPFWKQFQAAVNHEDRTALRTMMAKNIYVDLSAGEGPDATFEDLDAENGGAWRNLKNAMTLKPRPTRQSTPARPQMKVYSKHACPNCKYGIEVGFERGAEGWKWIGMHFPGD